MNNFFFFLFLLYTSCIIPKQVQDITSNIPKILEKINTYALKLLIL